MIKKTFNISGMHCVSCEVLLEKELANIPEIKNIKVSYQKENLEIEAENIPHYKIEQAIENCGYKIIKNNNQEDQKANTSNKLKFTDFFQIGVIFLVLLFIVSLLSDFEIARYFPEMNENVGLGIALLLGIVASVSTCLALTGGIVMSFSSKYKLKGSKKIPSFLDRALPQIYFHIGRIGGFFVLGGLLGLVGQNINYSFSFTGYLTIVVALIMFYIGLNILNILPNITKFGFHLPKILSSKIHSLQKNEHPLIPGVIGGLTFFLPCGFTQALQLVAIISGGFWAGGLIMAVFALGTLPVLFSVGMGSSYAQKKDFSFFKKIVGVIIVFFALYSFNSGLILSGSKFTIDFWNTEQALGSILIKTDSNNQSDSSEIQIVKMDINFGFVQKEFYIKKDIPVRWEINAEKVTGCSDEVIIPRLGLSTGKINSGDKIVLEFTPTEKGVLPFSCWMGMLGGKFIVQ